MCLSYVFRNKRKKLSEISQFINNNFDMKILRENNNSILFVNNSLKILVNKKYTYVSLISNNTNIESLENFFFN